MSRIETKVWQGKPMVMLAATPGQRAGAGVLGGQEQLAPRFGAEIRGMYGVGNWSEARDPETQALIRPEDIKGLRHALGGLILETA